MTKGKELLGQERGNKHHFYFCLWMFFSPFLVHELSWPSLFPNGDHVFPHTLTINILALWACLPLPTRRWKGATCLYPLHPHKCSFILSDARNGVLVWLPAEAAAKRERGHACTTYSPHSKWVQDIYHFSLLQELEGWLHKQCIWFSWTPIVALCSAECDVKIKSGEESHISLPTRVTVNESCLVIFRACIVQRENMLFPETSSHPPHTHTLLQRLQTVCFKEIPQLSAI